MTFLEYLKSDEIKYTDKQIYKILLEASHTINYGTKIICDIMENKTKEYEWKDIEKRVEQLKKLGFTEDEILELWKNYNNIIVIAAQNISREMNRVQNSGDKPS